MVWSVVLIYLLHSVSVPIQNVCHCGMNGKLTFANYISETLEILIYDPSCVRLGDPILKETSLFWHLFVEDKD